MQSGFGDKATAMVLMFHPTKYRSERISILSSPELVWSGSSSDKSSTWRSRPSCINNPCVSLEQQLLWQWCELSFRSYRLGELLLASLIRFLPTISGPQSARNLCQPRFSSASPDLAASIINARLVRHLSTHCQGTLLPFAA